MNQFIVASHGNLAKGLADTLTLFTSGMDNVTYISAYTEGNADLDEQIDNALAKVGPDDAALIFTDLKGGSVNQQLSIRTADRANIYIIAGFNLPLVMEAILSTEPITQAFVDRLIVTGQQAIQQIVVQPVTDDDDADFLN